VARFGSLVNHPVFRAAANSLEHRQWPVHNDALLAQHGVESIRLLATHFSYLESMQSFNLEEALFEWGRLKFETRDSAFFSMVKRRGFHRVPSEELRLVPLHDIYFENSLRLCCCLQPQRENLRNRPLHYIFQSRWELVFV